MQVRWFYDYLDANGKNVVHDWLHGLPIKARAKFQRLIFTLERELVPRHRDLKPLKGECSGLLELRIDHLNVEYRLIGCKRAIKSDILLLLGAQEKNFRFVPPNACASAKRRRSQAEQDPTRRICAHRQD